MECLNYGDIHCRRAFGALLNGEGHTVAFNQAFKAGSINAGKVNENVGSIFLFDETKALFLIEPFNGSICHSDFFLLSKNSLSPKLQVATRMDAPSERNRPARCEQAHED
jgi:hypothetical protein